MNSRRDRCSRSPALIPEPPAFANQHFDRHNRTPQSTEEPEKSTSSYTSERENIRLGLTASCTSERENMDSDLQSSLRECREVRVSS